IAGSRSFLDMICSRDSRNGELCLHDFLLPLQGYCGFVFSNGTLKIPPLAVLVFYPMRLLSHNSRHQNTGDCLCWIAGSGHSHLDMSCSHDLTFGELYPYDILLPLQGYCGFVFSNVTLTTPSLAVLVFYPMRLLSHNSRHQVLGQRLQSNGDCLCEIAGSASLHFDMNCSHDLTL
ncbi:hypothetical protein ACHAW6_010067, partial [Cyclotella cf. meneghiniana]